MGAGERAADERLSAGAANGGRGGGGRGWPLYTEIESRALDESELLFYVFVEVQIVLYLVLEIHAY